MPLDTDLNTPPYYDDFADNQEGKQYVRPIFKPSVSVQARELNNLVSMLQAQVERFGDAIYQTGTVVSGCNFKFYPNYPFAKITDTTIGGALAIPGNYVGYFVKNQANLQALVVNSARGLQSTFPNLNTLYLSYRNAGNNNNTFAYTPGDTLTVFDANAAIWSVTVTNPGIAFANTNAVIFTSAIAVNTTSGTIAVGTYVTHPALGSNLIISSIDSLTLANAGQVILYLAPRVADLAAPGNGAIWQVANNLIIINSTNTAVGMVQSVFGTGASATILTDGAGTIVSVNMTNGGMGYGLAPGVTIWSPNNSSGVGTVSLTALNFITQLLVSNTAGAVGNGYAFGVGNGIIYQKGYFLVVEAQTVIVNNYSTLPTNTSVGFQSLENIITSNIDTSLLDNVLGPDGNANAPGADRLQIVPTLVVAPASTTNSSFLSLVNWSEGNPYQQQQTSAYSLLGDAMAKRTFESEGNFVIDPWQITSQSPFIHSFEGNTIAVTIDPGAGYIEGYRVETITNFIINAPKATHIHTGNTTTVVSLNYGNWITVQELGGLFQFNTGDVVQLQDTARQFLTVLGGTTSVSNTTPAGNTIGTARIRSLVPLAGAQGANNGSYQLYLFNIIMNAGQNFANVKSVSYQAGAFPGVADVVLTFNPRSNTNQCMLSNTNFDALVFPVTGVSTIQNMANTTYSYRTIDQAVTMANNGLLTKSCASIPAASFTPLGSLTNSQLGQISLIPLSNNLIASANYSGNVTLSTTTANVVGIGTSFLTQLQAGDWVIAVQNTTVSDIQYVTQVVNNTLYIAGGNASISISGLGLYRIFPQYVPIPLGTRAGLTGNVSANGTLLSVNLGNAFSFTSNVTCAIACNILESNVAAGTKTASRNNYVALNIANNVGGITGPWCLGVADAMRLDAVYVGTNSVNTNTASRNALADFFINANQNEDYVDVAFLHVQPGSPTAAAIQSGIYTWLLVQFDAFTVSNPGFYNSVSYLGSNGIATQFNDGLAVANLASSISSWEVPQIYSTTGVYYDMLNTLDFRPIAANTATPGATPGAAPINPVYSLGFGNTANPANDKKFPVPGSALSTTVAQYATRLDAVCVGSDGHIFIQKGRGSTLGGAKVPNIPASCLVIGTVIYPAYPNMPQNPSSLAMQLLATGIYSGGISLPNVRLLTRTTKAVTAVQPAVYTQSAVGSLDRRIANLEYIAALTALETDITNAVIPSSINPNLNRFMYGFYVDNFSSLVSQQINDPQYEANVSGGWLTPSVVSWLRGFAPTTTVVPAYVDFPVVIQLGATGAPTANVAPPAVGNATANTWLLRIDHQSVGSSGGAFVQAGNGGGAAATTGFNFQSQAGTFNTITVNDTDTQTITASSNSGAMAFYFAVPPTVSPAISTVLLDPVSISIYQGNTLLYTIANNAVALTGPDQSYITGNTVPAGWFIGVTLGPLIANSSTGFVSGAGKILWTHNPANGRTYTIIATRQTSWDHWTYGLNYPIDINLNPPIVNPTTGAVTYTGFMLVEPATMLLQDTVVAPKVANVQGGGSGGQNQAVTPNAPTSGTQLYGTGLSNIVNYYGTDWENYLHMHQYVALGALQQTALQNESFQIIAYGLLPFTAHIVTVGGINVGTQCCPVGGSLGQALVTDASGAIAFTFFFQPATVNQDIITPFGVAPQGLVDATTQQISLAGESIAKGNIVIQLSAPNSTAIYNLPVAVDAETALALNSDTIIDPTSGLTSSQAAAQAAAAAAAAAHSAQGK